MFLLNNCCFRLFPNWFRLFPAAYKIGGSKVTADPTWGDIFECYFKAQSSKLERLFSLKRGKRKVRALSFELSKMSPQMTVPTGVVSVFLAMLSFCMTVPTGVVSVFFGNVVFLHRRCERFFWQCYLSA